MCRLQIINCGNVPFCDEPCAIGVVYCDPLIASRNGRTTEYYLMQKFKIRDREGCDGHNFFPTTTSAHHQCSACDPTSFALLNSNLTASNGDLVGALVGALKQDTDSNSEKTSSEETYSEETYSEESDEAEPGEIQPSDDSEAQAEDEEDQPSTNSTPQSEYLSAKEPFSKRLHEEKLRIGTTDDAIYEMAASFDPMEIDSD